MNAELANLAKEIGRIAQSQQDSVEGDKVAKFSGIGLIFDSPELESLNYHQYPCERADNDWFKVKCLAEILLEEAKDGL